MTGFRSAYSLGFLSLLGLSTLQCSTDDPEPPAVRILSPSAGQAFKVDDTVKIIIESDFSRFGGGVSVDYSPDSSKNWYLIHSFGRKDGKALDTLSWFPKETGDVAAGSALLIKAYDYDREFVARTEYLVFSD